MLQGKKIILGITGSIAAYKSAALIRLLVKNGAEVQVLMTQAAKEFITPLTLSALSKRNVLIDFFNSENGNWNSHVDLGLWADLFLIAPASANTLAKMACGIADNLLLTTYLSVRCLVMLAPAMDLDMYAHETTYQNLEILKSRGHIIIEPASGELASGLSGKGRMEEPEQIAQKISQSFNQQKQLSGKTILVTAGPTYEAIDPVRFIGNFSSGKMGYAIAEELASRGAKVILISGPTHLKINHPLIHKIDVISAQQMFEAAIQNFENCNAAILNAAVADYTPAQPEKTKMKRTGSQLEIKLIPTQDIAAELGRQKKQNQILVGFALETNNEIENAKSKLAKKNLDFIVLNSLRDVGAGFGHDTNQITILEKSGDETKFELKTKTEVAKDIIDKLQHYFI